MKVFIIAGPHGAGKTTLAEEFERRGLAMVKFNSRTASDLLEMSASGSDAPVVIDGVRDLVDYFEITAAGFDCVLVGVFASPAVIALRDRDYRRHEHGRQNRGQGELMGWADHLLLNDGSPNKLSSACDRILLEHTSPADQFVVYSEAETAANDGEPMFWSNDDGWGSLFGATVTFRWEGLADYLPIPAGRYVGIEDAREMQRKWQTGG